MSTWGELSQELCHKSISACMTNHLLTLRKTSSLIACNSDDGVEIIKKKKKKKLLTVLLNSILFLRVTLKGTKWKRKSLKLQWDSWTWTTINTAPDKMWHAWASLMLELQRGWLTSWHTSQIRLIKTEYRTFTHTITWERYTPDAESCIVETSAVDLCIHTDQPVLSLLI